MSLSQELFNETVGRMDIKFIVNIANNSALPIESRKHAVALLESRGYDFERTPDLINHAVKHKTIPVADSIAEIEKEELKPVALVEEPAPAEEPKAEEKPKPASEDLAAAVAKIQAKQAQKFTK
jgi:hypothetical protein